MGGSDGAKPDCEPRSQVQHPVENGVVPRPKFVQTRQTNGNPPPGGRPRSDLCSETSISSSLGNRASLDVDVRKHGNSENMLSETSDLGTSDSAATLTAGDGDIGVDDSLDEGAMTPMTKGER